MTGDRVEISGDRVKMTGDRVKMTGDKVEMTVDRVEMTGDRVEMTDAKFKGVESLIGFSVWEISSTPRRRKTAPNYKRSDFDTSLTEMIQASRPNFSQRWLSVSSCLCGVRNVIYRLRRPSFCIDV